MEIEAIQTHRQHELVGSCWLGYQLKANQKTAYALMFLYSDELANAVFHIRYIG